MTEQNHMNLSFYSMIKDCINMHTIEHGLQEKKKETEVSYCLSQIHTTINK